MTAPCCRRHQALGHRDGACGPLDAADLRALAKMAAKADQLASEERADLDDASAHAGDVARRCAISNPGCARDHQRLAGWLGRLSADVPALAAALTAVLEQLGEVAAERDYLKRREETIIAACERVADGGRYRADIVSAIQRIREERNAASKRAEVAERRAKAEEGLRRAEAAYAEAQLDLDAVHDGTDEEDEPIDDSAELEALKTAENALEVAKDALVAAGGEP